MQRIWNISQPDSNLQKKLSKDLGISEVLAQILINRNMKSPQEIEKFLNPKLEDLHSPFELSDIEKACFRIKEAIRSKEKIMLFGDYDVDGITGVVILKLVLDSLGADTFCYLPHRINEGYGLNPSVIKVAKENRISLLITVDCGITNFSEVEELERQGIDVIITDHHLPLDRLPSASAIINPKKKNCNYPFKELAGVGVVYKLVCAILNRKFLLEYLDLVCLGTIADNVPLRGENRIIAKKGLEVLTQTKNLGLISLLDVLRLNKKCLDTYDVAYIIAPRINAGGRIENAYLPLKLLLAKSEEEARDLAYKLNQLNSDRQSIEDRILKEAKDLIEQEVNFKESKVIVLAKENWHEGVLGIVASRIKDIFYRPTVIISLKEKLCRGSARSIRNFHITEALLECKDILNSFGGHTLAAGLSILKTNINLLKERLNKLAEKKLTYQDIQPYLDIDMELGFDKLGKNLLEEIEKLKPFGEENPQPLFYTPKLSLRNKPQILNKDTLKIWVTDGDFTYSALGFNMAEIGDYLSSVKYFDLVYSLRASKDFYNELELKIEDLRLGPAID